MEHITQGREFSNPSEVLEWKMLQDGIREAVLYVDPDSGTYCRMLKLDPGATAGKEALCHEFDEVVYIVSGGLINERLNERYESGSFASFPRLLKHGPLTAPVGALVIETRHYRR